MSTTAVTSRTTAEQYFALSVEGDRKQLLDDLAETVLVFRRSAPGALSFDVALELGHGGVLATPLLPGFALALGVLFEV